MSRLRDDHHAMHEMNRVPSDNPFNDSRQASRQPSFDTSGRTLRDDDYPLPLQHPPRVTADNSFDSRQTTRNHSYRSSIDADYVASRGKSRFVSYRLKGEYQQPWAKHPRMGLTIRNNYIVYSFVVIGVILSALICFLNARQIAHNDYCLIYTDNFDKIDPAVWTHEVQIDGFGTGSFDWTTTDSKNTYTDSAGLHIVPTLTNETTDINNDQLYNGHTLNLTTDGTCTGTQKTSCSISSNSTLGTMIPPVRSARLTTKGKKSIKYGKVEVVAKLPKGDWLWPAIWMMPEKDVYGIWPRSGEIDIMEARGNGINYPSGGLDTFTSTLHWGPSAEADTFWKTTNGRTVRRTDFSKAYHTFGIEWNEKYIFSYLDSKLTQVLFVGFEDKEGLYKLGGFATQSENQTLFANPWVNGTLANAPFDQDFYLILNVAVGSRNGWFPDKIANKPWLDAGASAQWDFYNQVDKWLPTWGKGDSRGMTVKSVNMWQQGKC